MSRHGWVFLIAAFAITRLVGGWLATHPDRYDPDVAGDLVTYEQKAVAIVEEGGKPYGDVPLEYPPGALPLILGPQVIPGGATYAIKFVALLMALDAAAFLGLSRLARRWGSARGLWIWVVLVPALGPIVYLRLDLLPAVATIWALERASAAGWLGSGASLSFGTLAKFYPAFFIPVALWVTPSKRRLMFFLGALWVVVPLIGLGGAIDDVFRSVIGYHTERSIQVESTWATGFLLAMRNGYESTITLSFGAFHIEGGISSAVKVLATVASLAGLAGGLALGITRLRQGEVEKLATAMFMILAVTMATGVVFSPQFMTWLIALGAAVWCGVDRHMDPAIWPLIPTAILTQVVFPFRYDDLLALDASTIFILSARNVLLVTTAALAVWAFLQIQRELPVAAGDEVDTAASAAEATRKSGPKAASL